MAAPLVDTLYNVGVYPYTPTGVVGGSPIRVDTVAELEAAVAAATGGETIYLNDGEFDGVNLSSETPATPITIKSASSLGANISEIEIADCSNIIFDDVEFFHTRTGGEPDYFKAFTILRCTDITVQNCELHGTPDGVYDNDVYTLYVRDCGAAASILIENCKFHDATRAALNQNSGGLTYNHCSIYDIRSDGFDFVGAVGVTITNNHFTDFFPDIGLGDHADAIQFWALGATADSGDVTIQNNVMIKGTGFDFQAIFINGKVDVVDGFHDFLITGNFIYNGTAHGVTINRCTDITISYNTIVFDPTGALIPKIIVELPEGAVSVNNNASALALDVDVLITSTNNVDIQYLDPSLGTYPSSLFFNPFAAVTVEIDDLLPLPTGLLDDGTVIGALTYSATTVDLTSRITATLFIGTPKGLQADLSAALCSDSGGLVAEVDATYAWNFGDGNIGTGYTVSHVYALEGTYVATLTVTKGVNSDVGSHTFSVTSPTLIDIEGAYDLSESQLISPMVATDTTLEFVGAAAVNLGRPLNTYGLAEFNLSLRFNASTAGGATEGLFWSHSRYTIALSSNNLYAIVYTSGGTYTITALAVNVHDASWHTIEFVFTGTAAELFLDDVSVGTVGSITGSMAGLGSWDLKVGGGLSTEFFTGEMDDILLLSAADPSDIPATSPPNPEEPTVIDPEFIPMGLGPDADIPHFLLLGFDTNAVDPGTSTGYAQGDRHRSFNALHGGALRTYNGDVVAGCLANEPTITAGTFNGVLSQWLALKGYTNDTLNGRMNAFAIAQGAEKWSGLGTFTV